MWNPTLHTHAIPCYTTEKLQRIRIELTQREEFRSERACETVRPIYFWGVSASCPENMSDLFVSRAGQGDTAEVLKRLKFGQDINAKHPVRCALPRCCAIV